MDGKEGGKGTPVKSWMDLTAQTSFDDPRDYPIGLPCPILPPYARLSTAQPTQPVRRSRYRRGSTPRASSGRISGIAPARELDRDARWCSNASRGSRDDRSSIRNAGMGSRWNGGDRLGRVGLGLACGRTVSDIEDTAIAGEP